MPFKSKAQRRKFAQLLVEGKITPEVFEEWNKETGGETLPERVTQPAARKKRKTASKKQKTTRSRRAPSSAPSRSGASRRPKRKAARKR